MKELIKTIVIDLVAIAGAGVIVYGVFMIFVPAAVILAGILMVVAAVIWATKGLG